MPTETTTIWKVDDRTPGFRICADRGLVLWTWNSLRATLCKRAAEQGLEVVLSYSPPRGGFGYPRLDEVRLK